MEVPFLSAGFCLLSQKTWKTFEYLKKCSRTLKKYEYFPTFFLNTPRFIYLRSSGGYPFYFDLEVPAEG
jgi:hypothetical protein